MIRSLRTRLLVGIGASFVIVLVASGVVLYSLIRTALVSDFDESLCAEVRTLAALVENEHGWVHSEMADLEMPQFTRDERPQYYQLWLDGGKVIERSRRLLQHDLSIIAGTVELPEARFVDLPDGRPGRIAGVTFVPEYSDEEVPEEAPAMDDSERVASTTPVTLVVARDTLDMNRTLAGMQTVLLAVIGGAVVIALALTAVTVGLGLKSLKTTAAQIAEIDDSSLSARLDASHAPTEVRSVIDRLNDLLSRIDDSFQRERAFSANLAHELRTPLAGLRTTLEVALTKPRQPQEYRRTLDECLDIYKQTEGVVENLLLLARLDAGQCEIHREPVNLGELLRETWKPFAPKAESLGLTVDWNINGETVTTDREKLRLVIRNLLDNAVSYANAGGNVEVAIEPNGSGTTIVVRNTHTGLSSDEVEKVFDRFGRASHSRNETGIHSGLGLALCRNVLTLLNGSITVECPRGEEFVVKVEL
ncbi:MAG: hypothetical protein IH991_05200 [Planctomycetes bacterium]|nr:hypothetical protein [Planctomycetota bacterium]